MERVAGRANSIFGPRLLTQYQAAITLSLGLRIGAIVLINPLASARRQASICGWAQKMWLICQKPVPGFNQCTFDLADVTSMCGPRPGGAWPTGTPTGLPTSASRALLKGATATASHRARTTTYPSGRAPRAYRGTHAPRTATNGQREASPSTLPAARPRPPGMPP